MLVILSFTFIIHNICDMHTWDTLYTCEIPGFSKFPYKSKSKGDKIDSHFKTSSATDVYCSIKSKNEYKHLDIYNVLKVQTRSCAYRAYYLIGDEEDIYMLYENEAGSCAEPTGISIEEILEDINET